MLHEKKIQMMHNVFLRFLNLFRTSCSICLQSAQCMHICSIYFA